MDRSGGPNHGTLYAAWVRIRTTASRQRNRIAVSRSSDGGHSFSAPELISSARRFALGPQLAVQPDGTLQVVWASFRRSEGERRGTVLRAASRDGGGSFSAPRRIERFANGPAAYNLVALAASAAGRLLACWSQGRRARSSHAVCSRSRTGARWRRPVPVAPDVRGAQSLVAVAEQESRRFWVSFYSSTRRRTQVRLYRSDRAGRRFRFVRRLASRNVGRDELGFVGDYTGLETAGGRVFAAYVLPRRRGGSPNSIYVTSLAPAP